MKYSKGITLIALVISIIVMLILAGVSLNATIGENGIITKARDAATKVKLSKYKEEADMYIFEQLANDVPAKNINFGREGDLTIDNAIEIDDEFYIPRLAIVHGELYYCYYPEKDEQADDNIPTCAAELGIKVTAYGNFIFDGEESKWAAIPDSENENEYYMCTPDLSGFNTEYTYYVSYEDFSNINTLKILNRVDQVYSYTNVWYDYSNQIWANVLTINNGIMSYWVWIPRFAYNESATVSTPETTQDGKVTKYYNGNEINALGNNSASEFLDKNAFLDVKFINMQNEYHDYETGTDKSLEDGWVVPSAFTFDGKELGGFWMCKYEVQEKSGNQGEFFVTASTDAICVRASDSTNMEDYTVYIDSEEDYAYRGKVNGSDCVLTKTTQNGSTTLTEGTTYLVSIFDSYNVRKWTQSVTTLNKQPSEQIEAALNIDISNFKSDSTYFVVYDASGSSPLLVPVSSYTGNKNNASEMYEWLLSKTGKHWYNYGDKAGSNIGKIWANIVTINSDAMTYWTYIPRYAYNQMGGGDSTSFDIRYISTDITDENKADKILTGASEGEVISLSEYTIPDAFKFDGGNNAGYWMSKYEVRALEDIPDYSIATDVDNISILRKTSLSQQGAATVKYSVSIKANGQSTYITSDKIDKTSWNIKSDSKFNSLQLTPGGKYDVKITTCIPYTRNGSDTEYVEIVSCNQTVTLPNASTGADKIKVDLSGYNPDTTALVLYNVSTENGNVKATEVADTNNQFTITNLVTNQSVNGSPVVWNNVEWNNGICSLINSNTLASVKIGNSTYTWFDYNSKVWANIRTFGAVDSVNKNAYWTYVPKYEFKLNESTGGTEVRFIRVNDSVDSGYTLPDAFKFANKDLNGIWVGKWSVGSK